MGPLPIHRIVRIIAAGAEPRKERHGTGFRISPTRALTSWHAVEHGHVRVYDRDGRAWQESPAKVLWPLGEPSLDAAILETAVVGKDEPWPTMATEGWNDQAEWGTKAYRSGHGKDRLRQRSLSGKAREFDPKTEDVFELTVEDLNATGVEVWEGISGAPVFCDRRGEVVLCGILRGGDEDFLGSQLWAVGLPALLQIEDFKRALFPAIAPDAITERYRPQVKAILSGNQIARRTIADRGPAWTGFSDDPEALANCLCGGAPLGDVSRCLASAYVALHLAGESAACEAVYEALEWALPAAWLAANPAGTPIGAREIDLRVRTELMAELVLASLEQRKLRLTASRDPVRRLPRPSLRLPKPKTLGIDPHGEQAAETILHELEVLTAFPGAPGEVLDAQALRYIARLPTKIPLLFPAEYLEELTTDLRGAGDKTQDDERRERWRAATQIIGQRLVSRGVEGRFYYLDRPADRKSAFVETLKKELPRLLIAKLQGSAQQIAAEDEQLVQWVQEIYRYRANPEAES